MGTQIKTRRIMQTAVDDREPFKRGNLWSELVHQDSLVEVGELPQEHVNRLVARNKTTFLLYVVYSFQTPIGWCNAYGTPEWDIPDVKYSVTTTHHQHLLRVMIDNPGFYHWRG